MASFSDRIDITGGEPTKGEPTGVEPPPPSCKQERDRLQAEKAASTNQTAASESRIVEACEIRLAEKSREIAALKTKVEKLEADGPKVKLEVIR